jgi:ferredoxin
MPYVVTSECILCGACVVGCESNAITEGETQSHIDIDLCIECGTCESNCPSEAIVFVEEPEVAADQGSQGNSRSKESPAPAC